MPLSLTSEPWLVQISKWHLKHRPAILNVSVFMYLQGSIHTKGNLDRETKDHLTFVAKVVDGRIPERTAYTVVSIILQKKIFQTGFFFSVECQYNTLWFLKEMSSLWLVINLRGFYKCVKCSVLMVVMALKGVCFRFTLILGCF